MTSTVTSRWSPIRRSVALVVATCLCTESAFAMVLADAGRARATIVIGAEAREREKLAARELARYLGLMSGATFNVTTTTGDGPTIFVGTMPQTEPIVEALRQQGASADSFVLRCQADRLYLVGSDHDMQAHERPDEGTCNAVYTLLDELGCKWYFPGPLGEIVPGRARLEVAEQDRLVRPSFWYRGAIWGPDRDWIRRNRGGGLARSFSGHSYMQLVPPGTYEKDHPEYFAVVDGRRWPGIGLCTVHPEVAAIAIETARGAVRQSGRKLVCVSPPDTPWLCECDPCRSLDPPQFRRAITRKQDEAMYGAYHAGNSQGRSDRVVHFANVVARGLRAEFEDARVLNFAYWGYIEAPVRYRPEPNVVCWYTLWTTTGVKAAYPYSGAGNEAAQKVFLDNAGVYEDMMLYAYYGHWSVLTYYPVAEQIAVDLPWFHRHGVGGLYSETHAHWATQGLNFYTMYRLGWDVNTDTARMFDDYYRDLFGPAAAAMRRFDGLLRDAYVSHPQARNGMYVPDSDTCSEPVLRALRMAFNRARSGAAGHDEVQKRLDYFGRGLVVAEVWCRAMHDLSGAYSVGSPVLAGRAARSFDHLEQLLASPEYQVGFSHDHWQRKLVKMRKNVDGLLARLAEDR